MWRAPDLGSTVRQRPLASTAGDGDSYSLGCSVALLLASLSHEQLLRRTLPWSPEPAEAQVTHHPDAARVTVIERKGGVARMWHGRGWVTLPVQGHPPPVVLVGPIPHVQPLGIVSWRPSRSPSLPIIREGPLVTELHASPSVRHELSRGPTTSPRAFYDSVPPTASCAKSEGARYHLRLRQYAIRSACQVRQARNRSYWSRVAAGLSAWE